MRQNSDDEEGFIPSDLEIKNKYTVKLASLTQTSRLLNTKFRVNYWFPSTFIKKEHPRALITPLTVPQQSLLAPPAHAKNKPIGQFSHPFNVYCKGQQFILLYSRNTDEPFVFEKQYIKNQVSLLNIEDKNSPSLKELKSFELQPTVFNGDNLSFDSRFESGNLHCAFRRRGTNEYHLFMANDTNTRGYNQWFYFSVRNMRKKIKYHFKIVNYRKPLQFFRQGQRIAVFSLIQAERGKNGWKRAGNKFSVQQSQVRPIPQRKQFVLSFDLQFQYDNDYVLMASSLPYSYSKLLFQLKELQNEANKSKLAKLELSSAGVTLCNNEVPEVTISSRQNNLSDKGKKLIVIQARQHPGEVWSSYVAEGIIRALLKDTPENQYLLENYVIKIFPMVNIDGVIYGNFRCDVSGVDLNRRWKQPSRVFHPQIFQLKKRITSLNKKWKIDLFLDLHGHSKKYNIFCYACKHNSYTCRILPLLIQNESHVFHMPSCTFGLSKDKQTTARAAISRIIKSQNVLTIETSTFGWKPNETPTHFHPLDLHKFAEQMIKSVRYFVDKKSVQFQSAEKNIRQNFSKFQQYDNDNQEQSGSDSQPEEDQIDFKFKIQNIFDKKFEHEFKSFAKQNTTLPLHLSSIVFQEDQNVTEQKNEENTPVTGKQTVTSRYEGSAQVIIAEKSNRERTSLKIPKSTQRSEFQLAEEKKSITLNYSEIGKDLHLGNIRSPLELHEPKGRFLSKNMMMREKKKYGSLLNESSSQESSALNPRQILQEEVGRSNLYRQLQKEQQKKRLEIFVNKFQKFIPSSFTTKAKGRLQTLQQKLDRDDPANQLHLMFENKRKIELQRIRRSIEDSTEIAQRQGKVKMVYRKSPVIDFKKFKQNEKAKQQLKKLGQFSERYLEGFY